MADFPPGPGVHWLNLGVTHPFRCERCHSRVDYLGICYSCANSQKTFHADQEMKRQAEKKD